MDRLLNLGVTVEGFWMCNWFAVGVLALLLPLRVGNCQTSASASSRSADDELLWAAASGYTQRVEHALKRGANINAHDNLQSSALALAISYGRTATARYLIEKGANIELGKGDITPLMLAAQFHDPAAVKMLLGKGANIKARDDRGRTALIRAVRQIPPAHWSHRFAEYIETIEILCQKGSDLEAADDQGRTALLTAVRLQNFSTAEFVVEKGADVNAKDDRGKTVLSLLGVGSKAELLEFLKTR